jgi:hypothetical protein
VAGSSRIEVGVQTAADLQSMGISAAGAPPVGGRSAKALAARLGAAAYPSAAFYKALAAAPSVSPFSPFYEVFLPAGVSHTLKNDALITLKYDDSVSTPSALNVYYFDPGNNVYLLENNQRKVDTVNKTITVAVRHLSTFVVLPANAPAVTGNSYTGTEVSAFNFPNPFDLNQKTLTLANAPGASASQTIYGTMIRVGVPPGMDGTMKIRIYDVAGIRVREISTPVAGGEYVYQNWDGRNDAGKKVASGVYIARLTLNDGNEKFFKMAVIK